MLGSEQIHVARKPFAVTESGAVEGFEDQQSGLFCFFGIPYAAPPVGPLRFGRAHRHPGWKGKFDACRFGPVSAQLVDLEEIILPELTDEVHAEQPPSWLGSEDSLTLNIWTQGCDDARRPVIIYVHGGANWLESSRAKIYHGDKLARAANAVVVTFNYRLGLFGFLDLTCLGPDAPVGASGNGLTDQMMAIDWVRANVAGFGGDPDNIMLIGESAGSMDISWMIAADWLQGRVQRLVMMSGVASVNGFARSADGNLHSIAEAKKRGSSLLADMNVDSFATLTSLSTDELMHRFGTIAWSSDILFEMDTLFYPRIEGARTVDPFEAANNGTSRELDIIMGFTAYEMGLWLQWDDMLDQHDSLWAAARVPGLPKRYHASLAEHYDRLLANKRPGLRGMTILGDAMFVMPTLAFAEAHARSGGNVWLYQFAHPATDPRKGALHAADVLALFDTFDTPAGVGLLGEPPSDEERQTRSRIAKDFQRHISAFAHGGRLDDQDWPRYYPAGPRVYNLSATPAVLDDPFGERWNWWRDKLVAPQLGWPTI